MFEKIRQIRDLSSNMGSRYVSYRLKHAIKSKLGWYKKCFPTGMPQRSFISLEEWHTAEIPFFIESRESLDFPRSLSDDLVSRFRESENNTYTFFNNLKLEVKDEDKWSVNPSTGYRYDMNKHWSEIQDLSAEAGDIKYVWERARFSHVYDYIRYDYHSQQPQDETVLAEIEDFIDRNPINLGPQYKCSQEISLRILNWTYALYYYKNSKHLTDQRFEKILSAIFYQLHHVWEHIDFSRIAVRNNHAITETLMLYLSGLLYPFFPESKKWSAQGKIWFEEEIAYQIYEDGTFLQHSMNYHRVVIQLLTWAINLSELHDDRFSDVVYEKAVKSLRFLDVCRDSITGYLPNYGNNDGALFFKFTDADYRDYASQLDALRATLTRTVTKKSEELYWYGLNQVEEVYIDSSGVHVFEDGGYFIHNAGDTKTFLKCGAYKHRPFQADNFHLDIWKDGVNYLWDCGTYKYNTNKTYHDHFQGSAGHNAATLAGIDHMTRGSRFVWFYWIKEARGKIQELDDRIEWDLSQVAYRNLGGIKMQRKVIKFKNEDAWTIIDKVHDRKGLDLQQHFQLNTAFAKALSISATDANGTELIAGKEEKWYSGYYGTKEKSIKLTFASNTDQITTQIKIQS